MDNKRRAGKNRFPGLLQGLVYFGMFFTAFSAQGAILFEAKVLGPVTNIYSFDAENGLKKITDNINWRDLYPVVSSQGDIAFMSNREKYTKIDLQKKSENFNIYAIASETGSLKQITHSAGHDLLPKYSPDGQWLAYLQESKGKRALTLVRRDGKESKTLVSAPQIFDFSWSPDSNQIAYSTLEESKSFLMTIDIETTKKKIIRSLATKKGKTPAYLAHVVSVAWSPDSKKIAYIAHPLAKDKSRLLSVVDLKTLKWKIMSNTSHQVQAPITWSKDSKKLLFSALTDYKYFYDEKTHKKVYKGGMNIFLTDLNGNNTQLTTGENLYKQPTYSPDEKKIAFLYSDKLGGSGKLALRTMNTKGSDIEQLYDSVTRRSSLIWN